MHPLAQPRGNLCFPDDPSAQRRRGIAPKNIATFNTHSEALEPMAGALWTSYDASFPARWVEAMKKPSRAGGKPAKRRSALKPKGGVPKAMPRRGSAPAGQETEVARLTRERDEALGQQAATADVLRIISSSPGNLDTVLETILANATRLCEANFGVLLLYERAQFRVAAAHNPPPVFAELRRRQPEIRSSGVLARVAVTKQLLHIADCTEDPSYKRGDGDFVAFVDLCGVRTLLGAPLLKKGELIGMIGLYRQEVRRFTGQQVELVRNFAAQAVIAIENARLLSELRESLQEQTATSEVLQVISTSPGDLEPVFAAMLEKAVRICDAKFGGAYRWDGEVSHLITTHNVHPAFAEFRRRSQPSLDARMVAAKTTVHVIDLKEDAGYIGRDPSFVAAVELGGARTVLVVPMLRENELIGSFHMARGEVRPFTDKQIAVVTNFATQAVIAIENARLLNELRQRTADLSESLEQQIATSEVLQVISSSPGDLQPVFEAMLEKAVRVCGATFGNLFLCEDGAFRVVAMHNAPPAYAEARMLEPIHPGPATALGRLARTKQAAQIDDLMAEPGYVARDPLMVTGVEVGGIRTLVAVPMLKANELVGSIVIYRHEVRPFSKKQVEIVSNFAAQAVIAIENARLLNELRQRTADLSQRTTDLTEALEQQTATSDVLQVISSSPGDLQPVFEAILEKAVRICDAKFGTINRWDGEALHLVASHNLPPAFAEFRSRTPFRPGSGNPISRMLVTKTVSHIEDLAREQGYLERNASAVAAVELGGVRTHLVVPMLKDNELIGVVIVYRQEVCPFTDKQIELVKNFAAQAVIAIENARLLSELRESLQEQTATSEVLQVISGSPGDLEPVFEAMLEKAVRICDAKFGNTFRWDGDALHLVATHNIPPAFAELRKRTPFRPDTENPIGRMVATKAVVHVADLAAETRYIERLDPAMVAAVELGGVRTFVAVPMLKKNELNGALIVYRQEIRPFTDKQIALVTNFAAQAVIAIENARLLKELRQRTEEVEKLNQHLEQRVTDQVGEIERMGRLRRFLPPQVADLIVASGTEKRLESHRREITALFCDLRGFTGFSESSDPEDVMALLREYHAAIGEIIVRYSGTLERYAGDGVMVVFNDPIPVDNPALQAVQMALEMRVAIGALTEKWRQLGHEIGFGIGIAHGYATLGTIGFEGRFDYAAIGTVSNVASRLCNEAKPGQILISPRVLMAAKDAVTVEPVGEFELKGIRRPVAAYNVVVALPPSP